MGSAGKPKKSMAPEWRRLLRRHQGKTLVELCRRPRIKEQIAGFVVGFSDELILLHMLDWSTYTFNGYVILCNRDIERHRFFSRDSFWQAQAVRKLKLRPEPVPGLRLTNWQEAITDLAKLYPLINVQRELKYPGECQIGRTIEVTPRLITIDSVDCNAEWVGSYRMKLADVTRIEFDGGYERALTLTMPKRPLKRQRQS